MKKLADGTEVTSRSYYFLLDFNDHDNWKTMNDLWGVMKLHELTHLQYTYLLKKAVEREINLLENGNTEPKICDNQG
jgi:hypothetical protein